MVLIIFALLVAMPGYWGILRFLASKIYRIGIISGSRAIQVLLSMMGAIMAVMKVTFFLLLRTVIIIAALSLYFRLVL